MLQVAKFFSLRAAVAVFLIMLVMVNLAVVGSGETSWSHSSGGDLHEELTDKITDDYVMELLKDLIEEKRKKIIEELKTSITEQETPKIVAEIKAGVRDKYTEKFKDELRLAVNDFYTNEFYALKVKNLSLLQELTIKYYEENKEKLIALALSNGLSQYLEHSTPEGAEEIKKMVAEELEKNMARKEYYRFVIEDILVGLAPTMEPLSDAERGTDIPGCGFTINPNIYNKEKLTRVKFSRDRFLDFQTHHDQLVSNLRDLNPPPEHIFRGDGIVLSAGGAYFAGAMVAIAQIRETGSVLPIELMINTEEEYDADLCRELQKTFDTKCVVIEREIGKELLEKLSLKKFQLKILGLLVTSFDNVIALDADNMSLKNPDDLFLSIPYLKTRFLLWPDLWQRTISSVYYDIARINYGEPYRRQGIKNEDDPKDYLLRHRDDVHFHDLSGLPSAVSTETGQMVFSKREHFRSFYLSLYYNIYGDTHYWRMLYQGSPGSGDRDTFVPALHVFNEPYHVVERATWLAGFQTKNKRFQETTIVQYDPTTTHQFGTMWKDWLAANKYDTRLAFDQALGFTEKLVEKFKSDMGERAPANPEVFFLHVHRPKINPVLQTDPKGYFEWNQQRNLGLPNAYKNDFGEKDWELQFNLISRWVACKGLSSEKWWKAVGRDQTKVCEEVTKYVEFLKSDSPTPDMVLKTLKTD